MATRKKTEAPAEEEVLNEAEDVEEAKEPEQAEAAADPKDLEIARLKAMLAKAQAKTAYNTPKDELERLKQLSMEAVENGMDEWGITVEVRVPRRARTEDPWYWININNRSAQIPADDKVQEMKLPFALTLYETLAAEERAQDYADALEVKDPVNNPH